MFSGRVTRRPNRVDVTVPYWPKRRMSPHLGAELANQPAHQLHVDRPALRRRLDEGVSLPLTLLVAAAGSGKTVLMEQWVERRPSLRVVWIGVEPVDDDVVGFSGRVRAGLAGASRELDRSLRLGVVAGSPLSSLAADLATLPETVIVLDDLHHIRNADVLHDLGRFIATLPSNIHVVISTRVDPPIAWSRLRLRSRILEIRQADLAMTDDESAQLLARITRRPVSPEMTDVLLARTEGWATGLQLAALTLRFHSDPEKFVAEFGGTDRFIAEYLTEEVLDALPAEARDLLLRMSPLDVVSAELLDDVLERSDGAALIERLEQESMFLVAVDEHRERFRFHHLFRDLLRYRLRAEAATEEARLLVRAAEFHLGRGEEPAAIEYLLRAGEWGRALDVIMTLGAEVLERTRARSVIRWIMAVPEAARAGRFDVALELGILLELQGQAARAIHILSRIATDPRATVGEQAIANVWISAAAQWNARPGPAIQAAERALELLTAHPDAVVPDLMGLTTSEMLSTHAIACGGRALFLVGDLDAADARLTAALTTQGISFPPFRVEVLGSLALVRAWGGRVGEAEALVAEALDTASWTGLLDDPVMADTYLAAALIAHERGHPSMVIGPLEHGTAGAEANHRTQLEWIARYEWALLAAADGRFDEALRLVDLSRYENMSAPAPAIHERLVALHMSVLRRMGRSKESMYVRGTTNASAPDLAFESAAAWLTLGAHDQARRVIDESASALHIEQPRAEIRRLQAEAWLAELADDHRTALDLVDMALDRADPDQLVDVFISTDVAILDLVAELAINRGGVADAILERRRRLAPTNVGAGLAVQLTERELEVLAYLPDHSTGPELARLCSISINTLKTHLAHIYRKLGVSARTEAIGRARELGLLSTVIPAGIVRA